VVHGERVERLARLTDFENDEALVNFERILARLGVEKRLQEMGIHDGDTVRIGEAEFTYS
jgi:GTP-binding protein